MEQKKNATIIWANPLWDTLSIQPATVKIRTLLWPIAVIAAPITGKVVTRLTATVFLTFNFYVQVPFTALGA